jgi:sugar phosphate isomerase/epimerase
MKGESMRHSILALVALLAGAPLVRGQNLHVNDGSDDPPKLWIAINVWGLEGLPTPRTEWSLEEKLRRLSQAGGFDVVDRYTVADPSSESAVAEIVGLAKKHGFRVGMSTTIDRLEQLDVAISLAKKAGTPYVDVMTGPYTMPEADAVRLIRAISDRFLAERIALALQTHRGLVTQDLLRTVEYAKAVPELRFDLDLSHYFVAGEIGGDLTSEARSSFEAILAKAVMLDGRVSNGEQVQIDIGPAGDNPHARRFAALWKEVMVSWLERAKPGDVLPYRVELGPPSYAILDLEGREISDRWEQTLVIRGLAERLFNEAVKETGVGRHHRGGDER